MYRAKHYKRRGAWRWLYPPVSILLAAALLTASFAWIVKYKQQQAYAGVSNFQTMGQVYFEGKDGAPVEPDRYYKGGLLAVNITNEEADNYLGRLRIAVRYTGYSPAYLRVRVLEQWLDERTDTLQAVRFIPYVLADDRLWYDNRREDLFYYYTELAESYDTQTEQTITLPFVEGVKPDFLSEIKESAATLYLTVSVEAVQPNRYPQFWNMERLPWQAEAASTSAPTG